MAGRIRVELRIGVNCAGKPLLSPAIIALLRAIRDKGSLRIAAQDLQVSYQHVWDVINTVNSTAPKTIVLKQRGGTGGGGATITEYGKLVLREYEGIEREVSKFEARLNSELNF